MAYPGFGYAHFNYVPPPPPHLVPYPFAYGPPPAAPLNTVDGAPANHPPPPAAAEPGSPNATTVAMLFMERHTRLTTPEADTDECPICLQTYTDEDCVQITGVAGCTHRFGESCLQEMLEHEPDEGKKCPLCRTVWILPAFGLEMQPFSPPRLAGPFDADNGNQPGIAGGQGPAGHGFHPGMQPLFGHAPPPDFRAQHHVQPANVLAQPGGIVLHRLDELDYSSDEEDTPYHGPSGMRQSRQNDADNGSDGRAMGRPRGGANSHGGPEPMAFARSVHARAPTDFRQPARDETAPPPVAMGDDLSGIGMRGVARAQHQQQPGARVIQHQGHGMAATRPWQRDLTAPFAAPPNFHAPAMVPPGAPGIGMPAPLPGNLLPPMALWPAPANIGMPFFGHGAPAANAPQANVAGQEAVFAEGERRAEDIVELLARHRTELQELLGRQRDEFMRTLQ